MTNPTIAVRVNGADLELTADEDTPLIWLLRHELDLKATKFGCGLGQCGACMVLLEGHPTPSCDLPAWSAADKSIETVEGLGTADAPHPVQSAILAEQAGQCGYCLAGMIVSSVALLRENPDPTADDVKAALQRHLCRCGAQNRIVRAVLRAAAEMRDPHPRAEVEEAGSS